MRIAVDAMGGDFAPVEVVKGALFFAREVPDSEVILVGDQGAIEAALSSEGEMPGNVSIQHAADVILMDDHPASAVRKKRDSSLVIAGHMVKSGQADATLSAGNTGAAMAIAIFEIGRVKGIDRPAIAATLPTIKGTSLLLDAGANVDCTPQNLVQFALLGSIYTEKVLGISSPRVGLLNIGSEPGKGNELTKATFDLLSDCPLNFIGNIEGKDIYEHAADVVVCDGFDGNVLLKASEGVAEFIVRLLQRELDADPEVKASMESLAPVFGRLKRKIDYSEYGAAPLLGVNGLSFIAHGRSNAKAIVSGLHAAKRATDSDYVESVKEAIQRYKGASHD
jgi:glycerol-3-phosphate acyltransferase PlsX